MTEEKEFWELNKCCVHYSGVDDGFYCYKCMMKAVRDAKKEIAIEIYDMLQKGIFSWGFDEGGDKLHFIELINNVMFPKFLNPEKDIIHKGEKE